MILAALLALTTVQAPSARVAIDRFMTRAAEYGQFNGAILVADGGRIVYERAFGLANMELKAANKSLELDPGNSNASDILKRIEP